MLDVTVFYIQEELPAQISGTVHDPYVGLKGTTLSVSSDSNPQVDIHFTCNLFTVDQVVSFINNVSGVSGFYAASQNGFVVLKSKTLGQISTLTVVSGNTILGLAAGSAQGSDQTQIDVAVPVTQTEIEPGVFAVSFPIKHAYFQVHESYFVKMTDGITTTVKRFSVKNNKNSASINFVS